MMLDEPDRRFTRAYIPLTAATHVAGHRMAMYAISARNIINAYLRSVEAAEPIHIDTYELLADAELIRIAKQQVEWAMQRPEDMDLIRREGGEVPDFLCRADAALRVLIARYNK